MPEWGPSLIGWLQENAPVGWAMAERSVADRLAANQTWHIIWFWLLILLAVVVVAAIIAAITRSGNDTTYLIGFAAFLLMLLPALGLNETRLTIQQLTLFPDWEAMKFLLGTLP